MADRPPRCVIIDEHPVVRQGVEALIEDTWPGAVVASARNLEAALSAAADAKPDIVVVDPWKAGADVGELVKRLTKELGAPIVVFTADGGARLLSEALKAGVQGLRAQGLPLRAT